MTRVLLGISGSIAAFRALDIIRMLIADGVEVFPIISRGGAEFVTRASVEALAGRPAYIDIFNEGRQADISHIAIIQNSDLMVTVPASADIIAKYAAGIADDPLALVALTHGTPHIIAPAMNHRLWENPATQANVRLLKERGFIFVGPDRGLMACNEEGWGRLSDINVIYGEIKKALGADGPLHGVKVLVTAGATREPIDDVRYITNKSSGKMGFALADAARELGADVTLVTSGKWLPAHLTGGMSVLRINTAAEMYETVIGKSAESDVIVMAAAVADYTPVSPGKGKIKKSEGKLNIEFDRTKDILLDLGKNKKSGQILVGFAAEYGTDGKGEAMRKCVEKNADFFCLNDISRTDTGFGSAENEITIVHADGTEKLLEKASKLEIARRIMNEIVIMRKSSG